MAAERSTGYDALGEGVTFWMPSLEERTEITGPAAAKLYVSSSTTDADLFLVLRVFDPDGEEVVSARSIPTPPWHRLGCGRRIARSTRSSPASTARTTPTTKMQPLEPAGVYELDVEIWPTCIVVPARPDRFDGWGRDYEYGGEGAQLASFASVMRGSGLPARRPRDTRTDVFGARTTIHAGQERRSYLLLVVSASPDG